MLRLLTVCFIALSMSACASMDLSMLSEIGVDPDKALDKAKGIETTILGNAVKPLPIYCKAPAVARGTFRDRINARPEAKGAMIGVWCPGDLPLLLGL